MHFRRGGHTSVCVSTCIDDANASLTAPGNIPTDATYTYGSASEAKTIEPFTVSGDFCTASNVVMTMDITSVPADEDISFISMSQSGGGATVTYGTTGNGNAARFTITLTATLTTNFNTMTDQVSFDLVTERGNFYAPVLLNGLVWNNTEFYLHGREQEIIDLGDPFDEDT